MIISYYTCWSLSWDSGHNLENTVRQFGRWAFSVAGPMAWNALPDSIRDTALSCCSFRHYLKTFFLLLLAYQRIRGFAFLRYINLRLIDWLIDWTHGTHPPHAAASLVYSPWFCCRSWSIRQLLGNKHQVSIQCVE